MWKLDEAGEELPGEEEALVWLRRRARALIDGGAPTGVPDRPGSRRVRLRDDQGEVLFEGTLEEAANL